MLPGLDDLAAKTSAATVAVDPTSFLLADHAWLRDVLETYRPLASAADHLDEVREAITDLKPLLDLHIRREEDAFFPAIEPFMIESGQGSIFDMYGEHDAIRIRLDQLLGALGQGVGAGSAYAAFSRSLLVHFENEEELIFAEASQHLSPGACGDILKRFDELAHSAEG
jgi:iron-sulfur cluster repair protein YtfE (RIC family)